MKTVTMQVAVQERKASVLLVLFLARFQQMKTGSPIWSRPPTIMKAETDRTPTSLAKREEAEMVS